MVIYGGSGFFDIFALQQIWLYVSPYCIAHLLFHILVCFAVAVCQHVETQDFAGDGFLHVGCTRYTIGVCGRCMIFCSYRCRKGYYCYGCYYYFLSHVNKYCLI